MCNTRMVLLYQGHQCTAPPCKALFKYTAAEGSCTCSGQVKTCSCFGEVCGHRFAQFTSICRTLSDSRAIKYVAAIGHAVTVHSHNSTGGNQHPKQPSQMPGPINMTTPHAILGNVCWFCRAAAAVQAGKTKALYGYAKICCFPLLYPVKVLL